VNQALGGAFVQDPNCIEQAGFRFLSILLCNRRFRILQDRPHPGPLLTVSFVSFQVLASSFNR